MFTVYTDHEIIEFDELLEAIEYCEETQCGSSGNAEIMLVDETGNELCQIDGSIKYPKQLKFTIDIGRYIWYNKGIREKEKKMKYQESALYVLHQQNISQRDYFQKRLSNMETDEYYTVEKLQEMIDHYQTSINYDNEWIAKNVK